MPQNPYSLPAGGTLNNLVMSANTVVKTTPGQVCSFSISASGSTSGSFHDCTTSGAATSGNITLVVSGAVGNYYNPFRHTQGIVFIPGTGQKVSVSYE